MVRAIETARSGLKPRIAEIVAAIITAGTLIVVVVTLHVGARLERTAIDDEIRVAKTLTAELQKDQSQIVEQAAIEPALLGFKVAALEALDFDEDKRATVPNTGVHAFLISPQGRLLAATISGEPVAPELPSEIAAGALALAAAVTARKNDGGVSRFGSAFAGFSTVSGRLAVVAATPLVQPELADSAPGVVVALRTLGESALRDLADSYGLESLAFAGSVSAPSGQTILPIAGLTGATAGALVWRNANPGRC
ncbi:MAG: hypothetical protein HC829_09120 [Bacteroidales bacterium]|nr:hypothetical protein [Bacteroidales bacterium]